MGTIFVNGTVKLTIFLGKALCRSMNAIISFKEAQADPKKTLLIFQASQMVRRDYDSKCKLLRQQESRGEIGRAHV